jgi:hypothetical protein
LLVAFNATTINKLVEAGVIKKTDFINVVPYKILTPAAIRRGKVWNLIKFRSRNSTLEFDAKIIGLEANKPIGALPVYT